MPLPALLRPARLGLTLLLAPALAFGQVKPPSPPAVALPPAPGAAGTYVLQGMLGSPTQGVAYLRYAPGRDDSAVIKNGAFSFKGTVAGSAPAILLVRKPRESPNSPYLPIRKLYLEPGTIRVVSPDSLAHAVFSGTALNVDNNALHTATLATDERLAKLEAEYRAATPAQRQSADFQARMEKASNAIEAAQKPLVKQFILAHPGSLVSLDALNQWGGYAPDAAEVEPVFLKLTPAVRASKGGQDYAALLVKAKATAVGALAPDFTQNDVNGKPVALHSFRGKFVLVDFWASWCGPCRRENPNVVANYEKYKDRNFTVLGVSLDAAAGRDAWLKAIAADKLAWTQVSDLKNWQNAAAQLYGVQAIPQNFLVGPDGRIVAKNLSGEELGQKLAAVLK